MSETIASLESLALDRGRETPPRLKGRLLGALGVSAIACGLLAAALGRQIPAVVALPAAPPAVNLYGALAEPDLVAGSPAPELKLRLQGEPQPPTGESEPAPSPLPLVAFGALASPIIALGPTRLDRRAPALVNLELTPPEPPEPLASAPLPPRRPSELAVLRPAQPAREVAPTPAGPEPDNRSIFEKLFTPVKPEPNVVAYAAPEEPRVRPLAVSAAKPETSSVSRSTPEQPTFRLPFFSPGYNAPSPASLARYDKQTAVYDIAAHAVYLPNGTKLEAHSGYGEMLDDPAHVNVRMRGATPPATYELTMREGSFHGVQALRLNPVGGSQQFGRAGLLVHPYMLGPNGDSNGCVSVQEYDAFLRAYENGDIKRLAVVARLD